MQQAKRKCGPARGIQSTPKEGIPRGGTAGGADRGLNGIEPSDQFRPNKAQELMLASAFNCA